MGNDCKPEDPFTSPSFTSFAGGLRGSVNNLAFSPQANFIGLSGGFALKSKIQSKPSLQASRTTMRNTFKTTTTTTTTTTTFRTTTTAFRAPTKTFRTTSTYPPFKASSTVHIFDDEEYFEEKVSSENGTNTHSPIVTCSGNLTLFSKTYFRGDKVTFTYDEQDLAQVSFDNKAVTASVAGECCWIVFSNREFTGKSKILSRDESYTGVTSLGQLFREISSVRRINC